MSASASQDEQPLKRQNGQPARLWERLVRPHETIQEVGARRQARLLSSLLIILMLLAMIGSIASTVTWGEAHADKTVSELYDTFAKQTAAMK